MIRYEKSGKITIKKFDAAMILLMRRCLRNKSLIFFGLSSDNSFNHKLQLESFQARMLVDDRIKLEIH